MTDEDAPQPDLEDLQQQQPDPLPALRTVVEGAVNVHLLPSRSAVSRNYPVHADATQPPVPLLGADMRRRRAVVMSTEAIYIGPRDDVVNGTAAIWPLGVPLELEHTEAIYVRGVDTAGTVSVIAENWAD